MNIDRTRKIQVIALKRQFKQMGKPFFLRPIWDHVRQRYVTGLELLNAELGNRLKKEYIPTNETQYAIRDGEILDLSIDFDFTRYMLGIVSPDFAMDRRSVNTLVHLFYFYDEIEEANVDNTKITKTTEAITFIEGKSNNDIIGIAAYLDMNVKEAPFIVIQANVRKTCISDPDLILNFKKHPDQSMLVFVHKLIVYDILDVRNDGIYYRGNYLTGTKSELLEKIHKEEFKGTFNELFRALQARENPAMESNTINVKEVAEQPETNPNDELRSELNYEKLKFEHYKLFNTEFDMEYSKDAIDAITNIINEHKRKLENVKEFEQKFKDADIAKLKLSATKRGIDENLFIGIEDTEVLKKIIINHIMNKK